MKQYVLTIIVASILGCSLLLAEDSTTQQIQGRMWQCSKMTCCKMGKCKGIELRAERAAARLNAKAQEHTQLAELLTNCANAKQKVADAAKAVAACQCMGVCETDKDSAKSADMVKQCKELCSKLADAQNEAAQAENTLKEYKKDNSQMGKCSMQAVPVIDSAQAQ